MNKKVNQNQTLLVA